MSHKHLKQHLPFINEMITSFKTADFKKKWQNMKDLIESKNLSEKQIETIDMNIKKAKQLKEQYKKTIDNTNACVVETKKDDGILLTSKSTTDEIKKIENITSQEVMDAKKLKQMKELKRLHENIVKDDVPLPSKRRSAQKRSYRDSLEFLLDKSDSPNALKKRKSDVSIEKKLSKDDSVLSHESLNASQTKPVEQINPNTTENSNKNTAENLQPSVKKLSIRKSVLKTVEAKPAVQPKSPEVPKITKEKLLKSPEIKHEIIESRKSVDKSEYADKDKIFSEEIKRSSVQKLKMKIQRHQKKEVFKKKSRATMMTKGAQRKNKLDDDEWEDMDETMDDTESDVEEHKASAVEQVEKISESPIESKVEEIKTKPKVPIIIKKVQNVSYIPCKSGFIFKCLVQDCKFQVMDNANFVDHIENEHMAIKWQGNCEICNDKVDSNRSIIFELMHMRENHVLKENTNAAKLPDITEYIEKEENSKQEIRKDVASKNLNQANTSEHEKEPLKTSEAVQLKPQATLPGNIKIVGKKIDIGKIKLVPFSSLAKQIPNNSEVENKVDKNENSESELSRSTSTQSGTLTSSSKIIFHQLDCTEKPKTTSITVSKNNSHEKSDIEEKLKIVKHIIVKPPQNNELPPKNTKPKQVSLVKPVETSTPKHNLNNSEEKLQKNINVHRQSSIDSQKDMNTVDLLRPWLKRKVKKYLMPTTRFLSNASAITATYKCMSSKCSFFTSNPKLFNTHLRFHETHLPGDQDYINCSYCDHIFSENDGISSLIEHIDKEHCYDKYQCKYCFYRSCVSLNVINHQRIYHAMKPKSVYELPIDKTRNYEKELVLIKKSRVKHVPPLTCVKCNEKFYIFPKLLAHMQTHGPNIKTKCTKCSEVSDMSNIHSHFINCHNLGFYQCVFCVFGSNNFESIVNHIGNIHPSKPPIYCERSNDNPEEVNPSSIDSTCLKFLTQQVDHRIIECPKINEDILRNEKNVGDLGGNFKICPVKKTSDPKLNKDDNNVKNQQVVKKVQNTSTEDKAEDFVFKRILIKSPTGSDVSKEVKIIKKPAQKAQGISNEKSSGLQIESVYSLNNSKSS